MANSAGIKAMADGLETLERDLDQVQDSACKETGTVLDVYVTPHGGVHPEECGRRIELDAEAAEAVTAIVTASIERRIAATRAEIAAAAGRA